MLHRAQPGDRSRKTRSGTGFKVVLLALTATVTLATTAAAQYTRTLHAKIDLTNQSDHVIVVSAHGPWFLKGYPNHNGDVFTNCVVQIVPPGERFLAMTKDRITGGHSRHYTVNTFLVVNANGNPVKTLGKGKTGKIGPQTARFDFKCK